MRTEAQSTGADAESVVASDLAGRGWTILGRNVRAGRGELDIVAIDPGPPATLVVVEVRWRRSRAFGLAEETIDHRKRAHLRAAIGRLLEEGLPGAAWSRGVPLRVDLVVVEPATRARATASPATATRAAVRIRHHRAISL
jgi:Holliday junction resolvase-like predicted endonuclease